MSDLLDPILGPVRTCSTCGEAWPHDEEFYRPRGRLSRLQCRACEYEINDARRSQLRAASRAYRQRRRTA